MVDPTSDVGEVDPDDAPTCVVCGDAIGLDRDHRVITWVEDAEAQHRHFCSEACLEEWEAG